MIEAWILEAGDEDILARAYEAIGEERPSPERCRALLANPSFVGVAAMAPEPVGFTWGHFLAHPEGDALLLYSIDVAEATRRQGAGRAMVETMKALAAARGCFEMWVATNRSNPAAMALYQAAGGISDADDEVVFAFPTDAQT
ncbi:MAG: GNAT family N-acetyltransferase [Caulobacter sp.]|nr:GNAT family N-acetyltransferase [Caulobacter sp.]